MSAGNTVYESRQCQYQADQGSRYCRANRDVVELNQEIASLKEKVKEQEIQLASANHRVKSDTEYITNLHKGIDKLKVEVAETYVRVKELEAQIAVLRAGLDEFGTHKPLCNTREMHEGVMRIGSNCDCGLEEALSSDGSELLEAVREMMEALENLTRKVREFSDGDMGEGIKHWLYGKATDANREDQERYSKMCSANDEGEEALSRLRGLV